MVLNSVITLLLEPELIAYLGVSRLRQRDSGVAKTPPGALSSEVVNTVCAKQRSRFEFRLHLRMQRMTQGKSLSLSVP